MKIGVFIYKYHPQFAVPYAGSSLKAERVFGDRKGKFFLKKLKLKLLDLNYPLRIVKDISDPDLEEITSYDYDFIILGPGYEDKIDIQKNPQKFFHIDETSYNQLDTSKVLSSISSSFSE